MKIKVTLKLDLNVDDNFIYDDIVTYVRECLPNAFGEALTDNQNPVEIVDIVQRRIKWCGRCGRLIPDEEYKEDFKNLENTPDNACKLCRE